MKKIKATLMVVVAVLAVIAVVSAVSASGYGYLIDNGAVSYDIGKDETTWTFDVTCAGSDKYDISHFSVAWCSEGDVKKVWVDGVELTRDGSPNGWDYGDFDGTPWVHDDIHGIKIDYPVECKGAPANVEIILSGQYGTTNIDYAIKADGVIYYGTVFGPSHEVPIPEFSTIAIPVAAILGLMFFFNRRKQKKS